MKTALQQRRSTAVGCVSIFISIGVVSIISSRVAAEVLVVVPPGAESVEGDQFGFGPSIPPNGSRVQQVYPSAFFPELPDGHNTIVSMAWRPDEMIDEPFSAALELELWLSTTTAAPGSLSNDFAANRGSDFTRVYSGPISFQTDATGEPGGPRPFDYVFEFDSPFVYDPSQGNLLRESSFKRGTIERPFFADSQSIEEDVVTTVIALDASALAATIQVSSFYTVSQFTFVSQPLLRDFDSDGDCNAVDIDLLGAAITDVSTEPRFDLNNDGGVNRADQTKWLADAAAHNGFGEAYLLGDSDLDGMVDSADLNALAINWRATQEVGWGDGDFTANGVVDSADLNALAIYWRQSIPMASAVNAPVPEPGASFLALVGLGLVWRRSRRR